MRNTMIKTEPKYPYSILLPDSVMFNEVYQWIVSNVGLSNVTWKPARHGYSHVFFKFEQDATQCKLIFA